MPSATGNLSTANQRLLRSFLIMAHQGSALSLGPLVRPSGVTLRYKDLPPPNFLKCTGLVVISLEY